MSKNLACVAIERNVGKSLLLMLRGGVDIFCASELHELADTLLQQQEDVVVSCEGLTHLDTSALQVLLVLRQELETRGRTLRFEGISSELDTLLQLAGLKNTFYFQATTHSN